MGVGLRVNGRTVDADAAPSTPLLWALRDAGCTGVRYGCGAEQCGTCTVLVDGVPSFSCRLPVGDVADREITTVEGLVGDDTGQRVMAALLAHNAGQCGYCLTGIVVTLTALLRRRAPLTRAEVRAALDPHLCRCGAQPRILRAADVVLRAVDG